MDRLPLATGESFRERIGPGGLHAARRITTLQINVGLVCNLACRHCHVESSPRRTGRHENMSSETAARVLGWLAANPAIETVDLTGGSPEMNPQFRRLVAGARRLGKRVIDRCNPTILTHRDPSSGQDFSWAPSFLAEHRVEVVASLPCYLEDNVRQQRGPAAYDASIEGLRLLNAEGYGRDPALRLNLVFNPIGAELPPPQASLAEEYHRELRERFGIEFNELWTITNMPIRRWRRRLESKGELDGYMNLLVGSFNPSAVERLMCRHQVHIDSQGRLHDCDFNFALGMGVTGEATHLWDVSLADLAEREIATAEHCYACTAGAGSSCGGAIA